MKFSNEELFDGILSGNKRILGKAITLIESKKSEHRIMADQLLEKLMPYAGNSVRVGITGVPGAGKSTFIESFGKIAIQHNHKVAVLAIDPSSSVNKGSILGDKTRMEELSKEENAFIRPSPSSGFLGGIANTTFETMILCEAAGYDYILIETVGVGQSEVLVADISDVFLFLKLIGGGDELQGIKRGVMEMVDLIFINKINDENIQQAKNTRLELKRALDFLPNKNDGWKIPILMGSALHHQGISEVYSKIDEFITLKKKNNRFHLTRELQAEKRFDYWIREYFIQSIKSMTDSNDEFAELRSRVSQLKANPSTQAKFLVDKLLR